jgi:hypothetical protein
VERSQSSRCAFEEKKINGGDRNARGNTNTATRNATNNRSDDESDGWTPVSNHSRNGNRQVKASSNKSKIATLKKGKRKGNNRQASGSSAVASACLIVVYFLLLLL